MTRCVSIALALPMLAALAAPSGCLYRQVESPEARPRNDAEKQLIRDFKKRVDRYEDVSDKLEDEVFPLTPELNPEQIYARQKTLAARVIKAFPDWTHGAILTPPIADFFRSRIAEVLAGPEGDNIRGAIFDDAPADMQLQVFREYPAGTPVATVPAQMLRVLPALPNELEYRFIGPNLILLDVAAFLIVDFIPDAIR